MDTKYKQILMSQIDYTDELERSGYGIVRTPKKDVATPIILWTTVVITIIHVLAFGLPF
jgi:hypothetical protein